MTKPRIFAVAAIVTIGALAIWAASTVRPTFALSSNARIEPLPMMARAPGLPDQRITDYSLVFVEP